MQRLATGALLLLFCVIASGAIAAQNQTFNINLPAQSLATSLAGLSKQTGVQIFAAGELVKGKSAPAVSGQMTVGEALDRLLTGSGLEGAVSGAGFVVQRAQQQAAVEPQAQQDPTIRLPQVTVQDRRENYAVTTATTGTKIDAPIMDIPQSIEVVPRQVIEDQRAVELTDVLRNVSGFSPSVTSQSQRFGDRNVIFRGFTGNNYYTNGFKDAFNGSSFTFGMANMDQVEVLKGPASVLYGLGDPGATVNIITKQPLSEWYASGSMTGAKYGLAAPELDVSGPLTSNKELRFRFNAGYKYQESFVDFVQSQRYIVAPVISWAISPNTLFTAEGEYQALSDLNYSGLPGQGTVSPNFNGRIPFSRYLGDKTLEGNSFPERTLGKVGYRFEHRFNDWISLRNGFRASLFNRDERDVLTEFLDPENERDMFRSLFAAKSSWYDYYGLTELNLNFKTGPVGHKFLFGSDQRYTSMRDRSMSAEIDPIDVFNPVYGNIADPFNADTPRRVSDSTGTFIGVYMQDLITIVEPLKLLLGVRYDNVHQRTNFQFVDPASPPSDVIPSKIDENVFTPRAGIVYRPFQWMSVYFGYSQSFNPVAGTTRTGSQLKPEKGEQYEGGLKFEFFGSRLTSTLAGYQLTKKNVPTPDPLDETFSVQIGEQRSRGFEFDISGELFPGFRVISSYAYTDARITKSTPQFGFDIVGNRPANVPENTGSVWGLYEFQEGTPLPGLSLGLGLISVGRRPSDNFDSADLPSYTRTDAAILYRFSRNIDLALNIKNLFNRKYFETSTFGSWENGISPGAPFTAFGTIRFKY
jgi:iron complex outermembrane recepter protein